MAGLALSLSSAPAKPLLLMLQMQYPHPCQLQMGKCRLPLHQEADSGPEGCHLQRRISFQLSPEFTATERCYSLLLNERGERNSPHIP